MPRVLLDTQAFYDYVRNFNGMMKSAQNTIRTAEEAGELAVSIVSVLELREMRNSNQLPANRIEELDDFLARIPGRVVVIPVVLEIVQAMDRFDHSLSVPDRLIAATAKHGNLTLMTDRDVFDPTEVHVEPTRRERHVVRTHGATPDVGGAAGNGAAE
jgi:predicted nucleic acid-binding protein